MEPTLWQNTSGGGGVALSKAVQAVAVAVSYADMLLPVNIGVGTFFLLSVVSALCQGVLLWQCRADVVTTLAVAYKDFSESQ